jgi:hypothetical protein
MGKARPVRVLSSNGMRSNDTSPVAAALHEEAQRRIGPAGRLKIALELSDLTHTLATAGIRRRNPEYSLEEARRELARLLYGSKA